MMLGVMLGIDIGGTNTVFGLVDKNGQCYLKDEILTQSDRPAKQLFKRIFQNLDKHIMESDHKFEIMGVGIGAPNGNYYTGKIENPPNLEWSNVDLVKIVRKYKDLPVAVTNDANAAALGEMRFGAAQNMKNFIVVTLGTGLGSGIVVNGEILYGHDGLAGEMGHVIIEKNGRLCGCGRSGCLEAYVSATGMRTTAFEKIAELNIDSKLRTIPGKDLTSKTIYKAARDGDKIAKECFEYTGKLLGEALANTVVYFSPEAIFILGGLAKAGDILLDPVREYYNKNVLNIFKNKVKILTSGLKLDQAAILGTAALIWNEMNHHKV